MSKKPRSYHLILVILLCVSGAFSHAWAEELPPIEAKTYSVIKNEASRSGKILMFESPDNLPDLDRVLLLRKDSAPVMGLRVLRTYPDRKMFAAKKVREYTGYASLRKGDPFLAVEKLNDLEFPPDPKEPLLEGPIDPLTEESTSALPEDFDDLDALETQAFDPDLDSGTTYREGTEFEDLESVPELEILTIDEPVVIDPDAHWISAEASMLRNYSPVGGSSYYAAFGLRYAYTVARDLFIENNKQIQDNLTIEGGPSFYRVSGLISSGDGYSLLPLHLNLRYTVWFGRGLAAFATTGVTKNFAFGVTSATTDGINQLSTFQLSIGGGIFFQLGPRWDLRADFGFDRIGAGLVIRF